MSEKQSNFGLVVLAIVLAAFIALRFVGSMLFAYDWSFVHWQLQPLWYPIVWFVAAVALGYLLIKYADMIGAYFSSPARVGLGFLVLLVLLILFGFDSVVAGYGNIRMREIAQADRIIYRWFEMGSIGVVSMLYHALHSVIDNKYISGLWAWKIFSYASTVITMLGSALLVKRVTLDNSRRLLYFLVLFFGAQTPVYFGFVGVEVIVPAFVIWLALFAMNAIDNGSFFSLFLCWLTVVIGIVMHASLAFLVPALLFVTTITIFRRAKMVVPITFGLIGYAIVLWLAYVWADSSLEFKTLFLFIDGKLPHSDYGLFDARHLYDMIQLLCLVGPVILAIKWSNLTLTGRVLADRMIMFSWMMGLGGLTWLFIFDPRESIVLELPRLVAYLAPFSLFAMLLLRKGRERINHFKLYLAITATAAVMVPMIFLPSYTKIRQSERIVDEYMGEYQNYYHDACVAYRDAYYVRGEYKQADRWEQRMVVKSEEYLNIRGSRGLAHDKDYSDAIRVLHQIAVANPYWADPRTQIASMQMELGRFRMAKPYIDTCLMLEPYNKNHHIHLYAYYRGIGDLPDALKAIKRSLELWPNDLEIRTDEMLIEYGMGRDRIADSLAQELYYVSDTLPYPYLVKGLLAAKEYDRPRAITNLQKFVDLAPYAEETPMIKHRIDSLKALSPDVPAE